MQLFSLDVICTHAHTKSVVIVRIISIYIQWDIMSQVLSPFAAEIKMRRTSE
jgi:hypothetical protein